MRVVVLRNYEYSLLESENREMDEVCDYIAGCLRDYGHEASVMRCETLAEIETIMKREKPDAVFNMIEWFYGSDAKAYLPVGLLQTLKIPVTGCPAEAFLLTCNKMFCKRLLKASNIPTAPYYGDGTNHPGPYIVKSTGEHASFGLDAGSVVKTAAEVPALLAKKQAEWPDAQWFAEVYIEGRELHVSMLETAEGVVALPVSEIVFEDYPEGMARILDRDAKWTEGSFSFEHTARYFNPSDASMQKATEIAKRCWEVFGFRGFARVDFRVDAAGDPYVIDLNTNPSLEPEAGFLAAVDESGRCRKETLAHLVERALAA